MKNNFLAIIVALLFSASVVYGADLRVFTTPQGGTGTGVVPSYGQVLTGNANGTYTPTATSSLRISIGSATSTDPLMAAYFVATSTTATSIFSGKMGIGTTTLMSGYSFSVSTSSLAVPSLIVSDTTGVIGIAGLNLHATAKLDVRGAMRAGCSDGTCSGLAYVIGDDAVISDINIASTLGIASAAGTGSGAIRFGASGGPIVSGTTSGNLGISTTTPAYTLSVEGSSTLGNQAIAGYFTATSTTATSTIAGPLKLGSTGTSQTVGNATLVGGTVTVTTGAALSTGFVHLTRKTSGGTIGTAITYTITNGSFTINSDNILDTSTFSYLVTN